MLILAPQPFPLIQLVANPVTGNVDMVLGKEAIAIYGPAYPGILRMQLEKALQVASELEAKVSQ